MAASELARAKEREARRSSYSANIAAAAAALASGGVDEAGRRLALCVPELRGWEWRRLDLEVDPTAWSIQLAEEDLPTRLGVLFDLRPSADGQTALAVTADHRLIAYDPWDGTVVRELELPGNPNRIAECPDGRLVSTGSDRALRVHDPSGAELVVVERAHRSAINVLEISPEGHRVATAGFDKRVRVRDLETGAELVDHGLGTAALALAWAPDGAAFATGSQDRAVRIHDADTGEVRSTLEGHEVPVTALAFDSRGRFLASGSRDLSLGDLSTDRARPGRVLVHELASGTLVHELQTGRGRGGGIVGLRFLPGDDVLASIAVAGTIRLTELDDGAGRRLNAPREVLAQSVIVGDPPTVVGAAAGGLIFGIDLACATGVELERHPRSITGLAALPSVGVASLSRDGTLRVSDAISGLALREFRDHPPLATALAAGGGKLLTLGGGFAGAIGKPALYALVHDVEGREEPLTIETEEPPTGIAMSASGGLLAICAGTQGVALYDPATGELERTIESEHPAQSAALDSTGRQLALSTRRESRVELLDLETGERREVAAHGATKLLFLDEDERLAVVDGHRAAVYGVEDLELAFELLGHRLGIEDLDVSADGARLATACEDGSVRVFDARTGEPLLALALSTVPCRSLAFLPDGRLAVGLDDGRVEVLQTVHDPEVRAAQREGSRVRFASQRFVGALVDEGLGPAEAAERVRRDRGLDADVRAAALALLAQLDGGARELEVECWGALRSPFADPARLERVRWLSELATARDPELDVPHKLLGMARYRLGDPGGALEELQRADELRTRSRRAEPEVAAFLAMSLAQLGRNAEAEAQLERLRGLMGINMLRANQDAVRLMAEAERTVSRH